MLTDITTKSARSVSIGAVRPLLADFLKHPDLLNIALLLAGFVCVLLLVPPLRSFPVNDDWAYAQSVGDLLNGAYKPHDYVQATALSHLVPAALLALVLGFSFTTLTISTLIISAIGIVSFYLLLRHLDVKPTIALLGVALLAFNPIYVYLSYSFMTDVTFMAYLLAACLFFVRGLRGYGSWWLWLGGLAVALAYLTRQIGLLAVVAALCYLWWSRRWAWRDVAAIAVLPIVTAAVYMLWEQAQPAPIVSMKVDVIIESILGNPLDYFLNHSQELARVLAFPGLCLLPLLRLPRRPLLAVPFFALLIILQARSMQQFGSMLYVNGSTVDSTGLLSCCNMAPIWSQWVWTILGISGSFVLALYLTTCGERLWDWLRARPWQNRNDTPASMLYVLAFMIAIIGLLIPPALYDRYALPVLPFLMLPALRHLSLNSLTGRHALRWLALAPLALFAVLAQHDFITRAETRWQAAQSLVAQGVKPDQIYAGYEWAGWYLFRDGVDYMRRTGDYTHIYFPAEAVQNPLYAVMQLHGDDLEEVGSVTYHSWLEGGASKRIPILKRK